MNDFHLDRQQVRHAFGRAARDYEQHDALQRTVQELLFERLEFVEQPPAVVVDVGAGTGRGSELLKRRYPRARVIALDLALPMLHQARQRSNWRRPFARVAGDAARLPLADHSTDILHANLCIQWCEDLPGLFAEWVRVLKPGGMAVFSSLGPDTLKELRAAWAGSDQQPHVGRFLDMHDVGDAMLAAGLREPMLGVEHYTLTYASPMALLRELKGLGATNADATRQRGLTGKARYRAMIEAYKAFEVDGRTPSTWEVITAHAWGPAPGQPLRVPGRGEEARFSIDQLRATRRGS